MATFVLVHGAWHGAWCWQRVARLLTRDGHDVIAPTLTGVCERSHLLTPDIDLDAHILDIVNEMKWQGLNNVVLVGHSYGGMVISGVAEKMEKSISSFVMLDAFMPEDGQAVADLLSPPVREALLPAGHAAPTNFAAAVGCNISCQRKGSCVGRCPMHAAAAKIFFQPLALTGARERIAKKTYIRATTYPSPVVRFRLATARARGWRTYEVPCGHDVMLDMPERLAEILQEVAVMC